MLVANNAFSQHAVTEKEDTTTIDIDSVSNDIPGDLENSLDNMTYSWLIQRSGKSECESSDNIDVTDSVCKLRLSKLPCIMELPFNHVVRSYIDMYTTKRRAQVEYMLGLSQYYFPILEQALTAHNLPLELKYLCIIESALNTTAFSRVGAAGLWQLMIGTGRMYGLEINSLVDERMAPVKASEAAVTYLKDLYSIYGDWHLVIAAYNCGPGNVNKAIRRSGGKRDYWAIYPFLPRETRGYVPAFIAANYVMNYAKEHNICPAKVTMPVMTDTVMLHKRVHFEQIASVLDEPIEEIRLLNAQYKKDIVPGDINAYPICLPAKYTSDFLDDFDEIVNYKADSLVNNRRSEIEIPQLAVSPGSSSKAIYHKVKSGETLSVIARRQGVTVAQLKKWNHLRSSHVKRGQRLKIIK